MFGTFSSTSHVGGVSPISRKTSRTRPRLRTLDARCPTHLAQVGARKARCHDVHPWQCSQLADVTDDRGRNAVSASTRRAPNIRTATQRKSRPLQPQLDPTDPREQTDRAHSSSSSAESTSVSNRRARRVVAGSRAAVGGRERPGIPSEQTTLEVALGRCIGEVRAGDKGCGYRRPRPAWRAVEEDLSSCQARNMSTSEPAGAVGATHHRLSACIFRSTTTVTATPRSRACHRVLDIARPPGRRECRGIYRRLRLVDQLDHRQGGSALDAGHAGCRPHRIGS